MTESIKWDIWDAKIGRKTVKKQDFERIKWPNAIAKRIWNLKK